MINYTLCSIKVYFRFIKDTLGLVQVVSSVVQVLSIILLVISSVVLTASRILQVVSTANKVHLSDFIEHTLHERFAPLHSCKNPPHQTPASLCSHGRGLIIDQGGMTRCIGHGQGTPHTHWVALLAQLAQRGGFGPATQSRMRHSLHSCVGLHKLAHRGDFDLHSLCINLHKLAHLGRFWPATQSADEGFSALHCPRHWFTHAAQPQGPLHNLRSPTRNSPNPHFLRMPPSFRPSRPDSLGQAGAPRP